MRSRFLTIFILSGILRLPAAEEPKPASYAKDIVPIFKRSCTGCHHPGKLKGELDLTTYAAFAKGGKHGPTFKAGDPKASGIIEEISGAEPSMPKEGDPLTAPEVALVERWIREGAKDDSAAFAGAKETAPEAYPTAPTISAVAFSPDGKVLAVSGYHEVVLHEADGSKIIARLGGDARRVESLAFSPDGKLLALSGDSPGEFGEIQIWNVAARKQLKSFKITSDALYGVSWSPDGTRLAFGCADKSVRVISAGDGHELLKFDSHSDWVFATAFSLDGKKLVSGSRDKAMKLIDAGNGQFIDDINQLFEGVLCLARHPRQDIVVYGGDLGTPRTYRISDNQQRGGGDTKRDANILKQFERQPGAIHAVAFSGDGKQIAVGGLGGEVRVYDAESGSRVATLKGHEGAVFAVAFHPVKNQLVTGGFDGRVRLFDLAKGELLAAFAPVPLRTPEKVASSTK